MKAYTFAASIAVALAMAAGAASQNETRQSGARFQVTEKTIDDIHAAMKSGNVTAHQLVQVYFDRINAFDKKGPAINCIITLNPKALEEADKLDASYKRLGMVGPLHGIPI